MLNITNGENVNQKHNEMVETYYNGYRQKDKPTTSVVGEDVEWRELCVLLAGI